MFSDDFFSRLREFGLPENMINRSITGFNEKWNCIYTLLSQKSLPNEGWSDDQIEMLLNLLHTLDTNWDPKTVRIGEREGRISTPLLAKYSGGFTHGVGRSGQLYAAQPKATGASLMQILTTKMVLSLLKYLGLPNIKSALVVPMGTGMSIALAIRGVSNYYNVNLINYPHILIPRVDHNSPLKGVKFLGLQPQIIEANYGANHYAKEGAYIDISDIENTYDELKLQGKECKIILSTISFFAPRVPDNIKEIAKFAEKNGLIHIVNNAYGLQSPKLIKHLRSAIDAGRVDAIIQSTDKNFLTPVGGAIITSPDKKIISSINESYAGRASASPIIHVLISLLSLGKNGYTVMQEEQQVNMNFLYSQLSTLSKKLGEKIIECDNPISCAMTLSTLNQESVEKLGGFLYNLRVTGPRVVIPQIKEFGSCSNKITFPYIVMNAAIGVNREHLTQALDKLESVLNQLKGK